MRTVQSRISEDCIGEVVRQQNVLTLVNTFSPILGDKMLSEKKYLTVENPSKFGQASTIIHITRRIKLFLMILILLAWGSIFC